jgi:hypothetical protein
MNLPDPNYDLRGALEAAALGYVIQGPMVDAAATLYAAGGYKPLTPTQISTVCLSAAQAIEAQFETDVVGVIIPPTADPYPDTLPPVFPTSLPRFPDSNEDPFDGWTKYGNQQQGFENF